MHRLLNSAVRSAGCAAENQRLEAQKQELLVLLKKQAKLVDILKRQKAHIEAAQLLSFTQADYVASESMVLP